MTLKDLLTMLIRMQGIFILQNEHGSMELHGDDLYVSVYNEWLTLYHTTPHNPESRSHLHLRWETLASVAVCHQAGQTPYLAFYKMPEADGEASLIWYFPSFYNWSQGKTEIPAHIACYNTFVATYGMTLQLYPHTPDAPASTRSGMPGDDRVDALDSSAVDGDDSTPG
jgi:hypothetical protein